MDYEWDNEKFRSNLAKHGVSFEAVAFMFLGPVFTQVDDRIDYGETRLVSTGVIGNECFVVVHVDGEGVRRIISARIGGRRDRKIYHTHFS